MNKASTATSTSRRTFVLVLLLFFAPLLVAFALYYGSGWRPSGTTNKGQLISPAIPLPVADLAPGEATGQAPLLRANWTLVYVDDGQCMSACQQSLATMQLVRQLLGKDLTRTAAVMLVAGACCRAELTPEGSDLQMRAVNDGPGARLLAAFPMQDGKPVGESQRIYLVDPLGNLMMSYRPGTDARDIYQDLKKLLALSHIG